TMLTPAITASRTSLPSVIIANAVSTAVRVPPFLYLLPFDDEMTAGLTLLRIIMVGARSNRGAAAASPAAVPLFTNSRRLIRRGIGPPRTVGPRPETLAIRQICRWLTNPSARELSRRPERRPSLPIY